MKFETCEYGMIQDPFPGRRFIPAGRMTEWLEAGRPGFLEVSPAP